MRELEEILKKLKSLDDYLIVVEGEKDKKALKELNIKNIATISGSSLEAFVEHLPKNKKILILTDFDKEGKQIAKRLAKILTVYGYTVDDKKRKEFKTIFKVTKIEELKNLKQTYKKKVYNL
jgi:5S rRNA maturation endonuclease (ribonuclease M5)